MARQRRDFRQEELFVFIKRGPDTKAQSKGNGYLAYDEAKSKVLKDIESLIASLKQFECK